MADALPRRGVMRNSTSLDENLSNLPEDEGDEKCGKKEPRMRRICHGCCQHAKTGFATALFLTLFQSGINYFISSYGRPGKAQWLSGPIAINQAEHKMPYGQHIAGRQIPTPYEIFDFKEDNAYTSINPIQGPGWVYNNGTDDGTDDGTDIGTDNGTDDGTDNGAARQEPSDFPLYQPPTGSPEKKGRVRRFFRELFRK